MSDRVLRFPDRTWDELEALPQPLRNAAHRAIFHLLDEPVPGLVEPYSRAAPNRVADPDRHNYRPSGLLERNGMDGIAAT